MYNVMGFERLRKVPIKKLGEYYWGPEPETILFEDHFQIVEEVIYSKEELLQLVTEEAIQPFQPQMSPWEFLIVKNYQNRYTVLIPRFGQILGDGLAWAHGFLKIHDNYQEMRNKKNPISIWINIKIWLALIFYLPYFLFRMLYFLRSDKSGFQENKPSNKCALEVSNPLNLSSIKQVCKTLQINLTDFITSAILIGSRRYFDDYRTNIKLKERISIQMNYNFRSHSAQEKMVLNNEQVDIFIKLPFFDVEEMKSDGKQKLQRISNASNKMKMSYFPLGCKYYFYLMSLFFPSKFVHSLSKTLQKKVSFLITNLNGSAQLLSIEDCDLFAAFPIFPTTGTSFCHFSIGSYEDQLTLSIFSDKNSIEEPHELIYHFETVVKEIIECFLE